MIHRHILTALHSALSQYLDPAKEADAIAVLDSTAYGVDSLRRTLAKLRESPPSLRVLFRSLKRERLNHLLLSYSNYQGV